MYGAKAVVAHQPCFDHTVIYGLPSRVNEASQGRFRWRVLGCGAAEMLVNTINIARHEPYHGIHTQLGHDGLLAPGFVHLLQGLSEYTAG